MISDKYTIADDLSGVYYAPVAAAPPRGPGRPSTGVRVDIRIPADDLAAVDAIAQVEETTRAQIIRELIHVGVCLEAPTA